MTSVCPAKSEPLSRSLVTTFAASRLQGNVMNVVKPIQVWPDG
ncbi:hypothetical protein [Gilvimarinus xylanilyticus]|nr:hypothetical protein [Gilvimarinus xylanilyticus]